ncbi:MAG: TetR/AcrR family transcriptional regulator [Stappiaceae bacterium]
MPRMSEAEKQKSHARILDAAADLFREHGIEATSVSEVMKAAGMTHGGFYRHFTGKDDLVAEAFQKAVDDVVAGMENSSNAETREAARADYIETYLSPAHVTNRKKGCPMAALGPELIRAEGETHRETAEAVNRVASLLQGGDADHTGYARLALLIGSVTLARMVNDKQKSQSILDSAKGAITQLSTPG